MGFYNEQILPRLVDWTCGVEPVRAMRVRAAEGLTGQVLELGFGSGLNLPFLPEAVEGVLAVEPSATAWQLAAERRESTSIPVELVGLDAQDLALDDEVVDSALSVFTLCTIPDANAALHEVRRVLRPGGELHFVEHGLSPDPPVAKWQHRLTPIQRRVFGGCHLDRPIDRLVASAGFEITALSTRYMKGPKTPGYIYEGVARKE